MKQFITLAVATLFFSNVLIANSFDPTPEYTNFHLGSSKKSITIIPNKATGDVQVLFVSNKPATALIKVFDANGKVVLKQESQLTEGKNKVNIDQFTALPEGSYTIKLTSNNKQYSSSFVLWK